MFPVILVFSLPILCFPLAKCGCSWYIFNRSHMFYKIAGKGVFFPCAPKMRIKESKAQ